MFLFYCRKGVPNSPRILTSGPPPQSNLIATSMAPGNGTSPKGATGLIRQSISTGSSRPILQYGGEYAMTVHQPPPVPPQHTNAPPTGATIAQPTVAVAPPPGPATATTPPSATQAQTTVVQPSIPMHESLRRYFVNGTSKFFGVNGSERDPQFWQHVRMVYS